jgi:hypothetical protein
MKMFEIGDYVNLSVTEGAPVYALIEITDVLDHRHYNGVVVEAYTPGWYVDQEVNYYESVLWKSNFVKDDGSKLSDWI